MSGEEPPTVYARPGTAAPPVWPHLAKVWPQPLRSPRLCLQKDQAAAQHEGASPVAEVFCVSKEFIVRGVGKFCLFLGEVGSINLVALPRHCFHQVSIVSTNSALTRSMLSSGCDQTTNIIYFCHEISPAALAPSEASLLLGHNLTRVELAPVLPLTISCSCTFKSNPCKSMLG